MSGFLSKARHENVFDFAFSLGWKDLSLCFFAGGDEFDYVRVYLDCSSRNDLHSLTLQIDRLESEDFLVSVFAMKYNIASGAYRIHLSSSFEQNRELANQLSPLLHKKNFTDKELRSSYTKRFPAVVQLTSFLRSHHALPILPDDCSRVQLYDPRDALK